jgi:hypothetical protein
VDCGASKAQIKVNKSFFIFRYLNYQVHLFALDT